GKLLRLQPTRLPLCDSLRPNLTPRSPCHPLDRYASRFQASRTRFVGRIRKSWLVLPLVLFLTALTVRDALSDASPADRVLGFESLSDWSTSAGRLLLSDTRVQGQHSIGASGIGYAELKSSELSTLDHVPSFVTYEVMVPEGQKNPWWYGDTSL